MGKCNPIKIFFGNEYEYEDEGMEASGESNELMIYGGAKCPHELAPFCLVLCVNSILQAALP